MKLNEISSNIKGRTRILVKGQVNFSRIANKIAGDELERANKFTKFPSKDPYYKLTIEIVEPNVQDALVFDKADQSETYLAAYIGSRFYASKKEEYKGRTFFTALSRGSEVRIYQKDAQGKLHKVDLNGNELATGVNVEVELNFFEGKFGAGVGMNAVVICDQEIKLYEGNFGVKGYEVADDTITMPARANRTGNAADVATADGVADETPVSDVAAGVEVESEPVGTTSAPSNSAFDALLAQFKANG